jgi:glycosyltransferase involved in cell wall biosynthesis
MASLAYEAAEEAGHNPYLAFNRIDLSNDVRPWNVLGRGLSVRPTEMTVNGMETKCVPRVLPEFEFWQYVLNGDAWNEMIDNADVYFGVGGNNQCCHPLRRTGRTFGCWVATLLWDERKSRLPSASIPMELRHRLSKPILEGIERRIYEDAETVFALSDYTSQRIRERYDIQESKIKTVQYPIDTEQFSPSKDNDTDSENDAPPTVLHVGRYNADRKNTPLLLEAFKDVRRSIPEARLQLVGGEPNDELMSLASELDIQDSVEFIEFLPSEELVSYYRSADVFVIPSTQEGLAIVGLESMACGTPVISTKCGGPEEYVIDNKTGYLVSVGNPDELAERIVHILSDDELRQDLAYRSRSYVEDQYSEETLKRHFKNVYASLE